MANEEDLQQQQNREAVPEEGQDEAEELGGEAESAGEQALLEQLEEARAQAQENWERVLRLQAELENTRRRAERDVEQAQRYGLEKFANELLAVRDSLELGVDAAQGEADADKIREGTELTLNMLTQAMEKFGITEIDPAGERFNPDYHQAMTIQQNDELEPNTVVTVMQKGYMLNDRLLRPAMVVVSKPSEQSSA